MCIACWILKATNTHSEYVTLMTFPPQQWLQERASILSYAYIACVTYCILYFIVIVWVHSHTKTAKSSGNNNWHHLLCSNEVVSWYSIDNAMDTQILDPRCDVALCLWVLPFLASRILRWLIFRKFVNPWIRLILFISLTSEFSSFMQTPGNVLKVDRDNFLSYLSQYFLH